MLKGFKDFLMRGNVIDLAVAVVIGAAFTGVINAFAKDFIGSLLAAFGGAPDFNTISFGVNGTQIRYGTTITALINFIIVAAIIYFLIVLPMNKLLELRRGRTSDEVPSTPEDIALLTEIRDLLATRRDDA